MNLDPLINVVMGEGFCGTSWSGSRRVLLREEHRPHLAPSRNNPLALESFLREV